MTMPILSPLLGVREADLADRGEAARIDAFVRDQAAATPFHLAGWSRAVQRGCGQRARYLVAERADGRVAGVLPLTEMRSALFGRALVSTGFGVDGGVLGEGLEPLAAAAGALADRLGIAGVELRGGAAPAGWTVDDASYLGFVRPLAADDAAELLAVPRRQRAEIRRSLGFDLEVVVGRDAGLLDEHYRAFAESVRNLGTPVFPAALFRAVAAELDSDVLIVRRDGRTVSAIFTLYLNGTAYPYWQGNTAAARRWRGSDRALFGVMGHARARGCTRFDFGRSKAGSGGAAFKKNWGFAPVPLRYASRGAMVRAVNPTNPRYTAMVAAWKKLPLPVATLIGPWIARGLG